MLIDVTKCVSCWWCYAACKEYNSLPETFRPDMTDPPALSPKVWTTLHTVKRGDAWFSRKTACNHCTDAACVQVCPTGVLTFGRFKWDGSIKYDRLEASPVQMKEK